MNKPLRFMACLIMIFLLQGCIEEDKSNWISENDCDLPCWNGMIVGITTQDELLPIINRILILDQNRIILDGHAWEFFSGTSYFRYKERDINGVVYYINKIIENLTFSGELDTTFGDMVELVGVPDYIIVIPLLLPTTSLEVTAIYTTLGISYSYNTHTLPKRMRDQIGPDIPINYVMIFDPKIFDELIDASLFGQGYYNGEETRKSLRPWDGFGVLLEKYPAAKKQN